MRLILHKLKPYRLLVFLTLVLLFASAMFELYLPSLMSDIVNKGIGATNAAGEVVGDTGTIIRIGAYMLLTSLLVSLTDFGANYVAARSSMGFGRDLRGDVFRKVSSYSLHEVDKFGTSSLITRTTNDVGQVQMMLSFGLRMMVNMPLNLIGGIIMAVTKAPSLAWIVAIAMPLLALVVVLNIKVTTPLFKVMQTKLDTLNRVLREKLSGMRVIRAFNNVDRERKRFDDANYDLTETSLKAMHRMTLMQPLNMLIFNGAALAVLWFGGWRAAEGNISAGDLMAFTQYLMQILMSVMMASMMFTMIPRAMVSINRIGAVLEENPSIDDPAKPISPSEKIHGKVTFDHVTFRYPGAENAVLEDITFTADPGETVAIIGSTGSGKSTLINLIPRFYDVAEGSVKVDGVDVRDMRKNDLRGRIGYIPQKALLFTGSISENIRYGKPDATDEEVRDAARIAQALDFIEAMPEGFDSMLAQDATNVSGGQKQRISIARALVRRPEIYIFDDSFSALDFKTDAALREALRPVSRESTVLIVAQRVSTVMSADRILVLDEGKLVGIGKHSELMESCQVYREIVASQLKEEDIA